MKATYYDRPDATDPNNDLRCLMLHSDTTSRVFSVKRKLYPNEAACVTALTNQLLRFLADARSAG